jgi:ATP-binding cassette subfamily A (ABC1) protein 3
MAGICADVYWKGNPPLLLLDEPTSSIDASSKLSLWKTLAEIQTTNRSLLLTTHSMQESSHLATRAAILSHHLLALGTISDLRRRYGNMYHVHVILRSAPESTTEEIEGVEAWIGRCFEGAKVEKSGNFGGQIKFCVPADSGLVEEVGKSEGSGTTDEISRLGARDKGNNGGEKKWRGRKEGIGELFRKLEGAKEDMGLGFYSVQGTSMDEVFLRVVRENNVQEEGSGK